MIRMTLRRLIGFSVYTNGKRRNPQSWHKFLEEVTEAAAKRPKGGPYNLIPAADPSTLWGQPIPLDKRCDFIHQKGPNKSKRCGRWAMKGAKRCPVHGGYRQNPKHPATIKRLDHIVHAVQEVDAARTLRLEPDKGTHNTIRTYLRERGEALNPSTVLEGIKAMQMDDNGKAFRRWAKTIEKHSAKPEQRARKQRLNSRQGKA